jgi:hypothetical protein
MQLAPSTLLACQWHDHLPLELGTDLSVSNLSFKPRDCQINKKPAPQSAGPDNIHYIGQCRITQAPTKMTSANGTRTSLFAYTYARIATSIPSSRPNCRAKN